MNTQFGQIKQQTSIPLQNSPLMDLQLQQESSDEYLFDEFENEDDVFYSELRKQVLLLTAEDDVDDEEICENKTAAAAKQGLTNGLWSVQLQKQGYYNWPGNKEQDNSPPKWISNLWRTGNGTGVFIPQIVQSRGRSRPRKKKGKKGRKQPKVDKDN